ncbi:MAG: tRNA (adenosine(37)-N6)-threonylcarbamoyltransferase complex ATPase subunit type 1 TsaE [Candidatus Nanopelagicales bacterium]|nr:tRNA (adenosine(37)-N6)-threonylcarbamoyltransferase complex ATPase subunit type 1 TsaE [Candidatus Nanopelagicales bacterium]
MVRPVLVPSAAAMHELGVRIAHRAQAGDVIILTGELGAGKTTLAQGIARGLGITEPVTSPTFVLSKHYSSDPLDLVHLDVYRISSVDDLADLWSESQSRSALTLVEWGAPWAAEFGESVAELALTEVAEDQRSVEVVAHSGTITDIAQRLAGVL